MIHLKNLFRNTFFKSIGLLISGSIAAQAITIIATPFMTRMYSPEAIGTFTLVLSAASMFYNIANLKYDVVVVSEQDKKSAFALMRLSIKINFLICFLSSIGFAFYLIWKQEKDQIVLQILCFSLLLFLNGLLNVARAYNNRTRQYKQLAGGHVVRVIGQDVGPLAVGCVSATQTGLLGTRVAGLLMELILYLRRLIKYNITDFKDIFKRDQKLEKKMAKKYIRQPTMASPAIFANSFAYSSVNLFVESLYGSATLGYYGVSFKVLGLPLSIVSGNIGQVFFKDASEEYAKNGTYRKSLIKSSVVLGIVAVPMVICMYLVAPAFCELYFGRGWGIAGEYIRILAPMFGFRFVVSALTQGLVIVSKQIYDLILQCCFALISLVVYFISSIADVEIADYLTVVSIGFSVVYIAYYVVLFKMSKGKKS